MRVKALQSNKIAGNALWIMAGRLVNKVTVFLAGILTARYLGPEDYGILGYGAAWLPFFAALSGLGLQNVMVRELVEHPRQEGTAMGTALGLRLMAGVLCALAMAGIALLVDRDEPLSVAVTVLMALSLLLRGGETVKQWLLGRLQSRYAAAASVAGCLLSAAYKVLLVVLGKDVRWFALGVSVEYAVQTVYLMLVYKRRGGGKLAFSREMAARLLRSGSAFMISGLMVAVYAGTDKLMLGQLMDKTAVAGYTLAVSLCTAWGFVLEAVIDSMQPAIMKAHIENRQKYLEKNRKLYRLVFYGALGMSLVLCLMAEPIVLLLYGREYASAVVPLRIVVWYTAFSYLGGARNAWAVCENAQKYLTVLYAGSAAANVALNLALIPLWGSAGAALASLVTQILSTFVLPACIPALRPNVRLMLEAVLIKKT